MLRADTLSGALLALIALQPGAALASTSSKTPTVQSDAQDDERAQILANNANIAYETGDYAKAVQLYTELLRVKPVDARVLHNRGNSYSKIADWEHALSDYTSALLLVPHLVPALVNRAGVYDRLGRLDEALADYEAAARLSPRDGFIAYHKGVILMGLGRRASAAQIFDHIISSSPTFASAHVERGFLYLAEGSTKDAENEFRAALLYEPGNARAEDGLIQLRLNAVGASDQSREKVHDQVVGELIETLDRTCFSNGEDAGALLEVTRGTSWKESPPQVGGVVRIWTGSTPFGSGRLAFVRTVDSASSVCSLSADGVTPHLFEDFRAKFSRRYRPTPVAEPGGDTPSVAQYQIAHRANCNVKVILLQSSADVNRLTVRLKHAPAYSREM
ncbi:tetratricopeptide repeat protein [Hyphomicrobium sp.]|uniref:tetratricopeptide repeat protein n=1 Tax=Hyphomicrobium sp. TaxID=82 RepID=UPI001DB79654|nr:tetratricopeptide repeat protein [Hyphomicrobium sp.]MBY0558510.1 tetratricopeptide repeat protein [Hyphomicrobium sp.]